jgi:hypothetical protein
MQSESTAIHTYTKLEIVHLNFLVFLLKSLAIIGGRTYLNYHIFFKKFFNILRP